MPEAHWDKAVVGEVCSEDIDRSLWARLDFELKAEAVLDFSPDYRWLGGMSTGSIG